MDNFFSLRDKDLEFGAKLVKEVLAIPEDDGKNSLKFLLLTKTLGCVVL
jgi:hypothetical protein